MSENQNLDEVVALLPNVKWVSSTFAVLEQDMSEPLLLPLRSTLVGVDERLNRVTAYRNFNIKLPTSISSFLPSDLKAEDDCSQNNIVFTNASGRPQKLFKDTQANINEREMLLHKLVESLPEEFKSPASTALYESVTQSIMSLDGF